MALQAGFAETDITPIKFPVRTYFAFAEDVIDPIFAHAAVFDNGNLTMAFLSLDVVIVEMEYVLKIRQLVAEKTGISETSIMVCATHNHACPAVVDRPGSEKDPEYVDYMISQGVDAVVAAYNSMKPVTMGIETCFEGRVSFNRRFIKKDGTVISQPQGMPDRDDILCCEGPIDPELSVMAFKNINNDKIIGVMINFACHAVHHMGSLSAGYPGIIYQQLKKTYGDDCRILFLNGACGNIHHHKWGDPDYQDTKEHIGSILAEDTEKLISKMTFNDVDKLSISEETVSIDYREIEGLKANIDNLEKFNVFPALITKNWYRYSLEKLTEMHASSKGEKAIIQAARIGNICFGMVPAEYFCENALYIKEHSPVEKTLVVTLANGWLGYIPHPEAFKRAGGHESTWAVWSKMATDAGRTIADTILSQL